MGLFDGVKKALNKAGDFLVKSVDVIQTGLDILGFVPVVGAVADAINAGIYVARGDYKNAALSALSAVPGIGDAAGALKLSAKAAKLAKNATKAAKIAEKGIYLNDMKNDLAKGDLLSLGMRILGPAATKGIARVGAKAVKNVGNKLSNKFAKFKKWCKCNRFWGSCFTEETLVFTESGYIPIREVPVGSLVYSMNEENGEIGLKEVEKVSRSSAHTIYSIQINGDVEINTTAYHQFYLDGEGWVSAINLKVADRLLTGDGIALITSIKKTRNEEKVPVFNFSIKDWVSYFVTKFQVYVHNGGKKPCTGNGSKDSGDINDNIPNEYKSEVEQAINAQEKAEDIAQNYNGKSVASDGDINTLSGWGKYTDSNGDINRSVTPQDVIDKSNDIGHTLQKNSFLDNVNNGGQAGQAKASHAEKQLSLQTEKPIGVAPIDVCTDCRDYFEKLAIYEKRDIVIADPNKVRIFKSDGSILEYDR